MCRLQLLRAEGDYVESIFSAVQSPQLLRFSPRLVWLSWDSCPCTSLPAWIPLQKLRVLEINGSKLDTLWPDEYDQAPLKLRELIIDAPLSKIPKSIGKLRDLEKLVLRRNEHLEEANLKTFLDELCHLKSLKFLVLRKCSNMESLPDSFVNLTNLEHLDLSECSNLQKLPSSFGKLQNLQLIDLSGCVRLKTLEKANLKTFLDEICHLKSLKFLGLREYSNMELLPDSFVNLTNLEYLDLSECSNLQKLPISFGKLQNLELIDLSGCVRLKTFPPGRWKRKKPPRN